MNFSSHPRRPVRRTAVLVAAALLAASLSGTAVLPATATPPTASPAHATVTGPAVTAGAALADGSYATERRVPRLVKQWARAWNAGDAEALAALFTRSATYQDFAFNASFTGRDQIAEWVRITHSSISDPNVEVTDAFRTDDRIAVRWTFSGQIVGAPKPFSVPVATVMEIRGGKISFNGDFYNLAEVLRQSGLPAGTTF